MGEDKVRHIVSLSGGKDSTALAIYMRDRHPDLALEFAFSDTDKELPETYEYLDKLEAYLGQEIVRLRSEYGFDHWLQVYGGYLPSSRMRWCTKMLKIRPFERFIGRDQVHMYIGIRADENREGYRPSKSNIHPVYPFVENGMRLDDIHAILEESGIGFPSYYAWRTRSGCYFCFFQQKQEWLGLRQHHPELFEKAKEYEKVDQEGGRRFTWSDGESLTEVEQEKRRTQILESHQKRCSRVTHEGSNGTLLHVLTEMDEDAPPLPCSFCQI